MSPYILVLAAFVGLAAATPPGKQYPGFTYIGSFRQFDGKQFNENDYYASASSGDWSRAEEDCRSVFGPNGYIMALESQAEQEFLNKWLQDRGSGGAIYWTSGQYDTTTSTWRWPTTNAEVVYTNWGQGQPDNQFGVSRIALNHLNQFSAFWISSQNTGLHRYVCEYHRDSNATTTAAPPTPTTPDPTKPIPCPVTNDLVAVLDASGSIGEVNFETLKEFVALLATAFLEQPDTRVGFVVYSGTVQTVVDIAESLNSAEVVSRIQRATYLSNTTATDMGIREATRMLNAESRGVPKSYLVITDGASDDPVKTVDAARAAEESGIRTFVVGVTDNINEGELLAIANGNSNNVYRTRDFDTIVELLRAVSLGVCPNNSQFKRY